jgi:hypothetical protein
MPCHALCNVPRTTPILALAQLLCPCPCILLCNSHLPCRAVPCRRHRDTVGMLILDGQRLHPSALGMLGGLASGLGKHH